MEYPNDLHRLTPGMVKDAVFWIILSMYISEFYPKEFNASRRWLAMGVALSTDHLLPSPQRVTCISVIYESNRWGEFRRAIDLGLSVLPFSNDMKELLKRLFNERVEAKLIDTILDYVSEHERQTDEPLFFWDTSPFDSSSDEETSALPFNWDNPNGSSSSQAYTGGTHADLLARHQPLLPRPRRSTDHHARRQLRAQLALARLEANPRLQDPEFRPMVLEDVTSTSESELVQNIEPRLNFPQV